MRIGADRPGHISRLPGGVAMNIAMTLCKFGMRPVLLTAVGNDEQGRELLNVAGQMGMETRYVHISPDLPTDIYMAIEDGSGLIAAIADAHSLESAGSKILEPLVNGSLAGSDDPYRGTIALDGNLTETLLAEISGSPHFAEADLRVAPASPGKAERLRPLLGHQCATFYVNLEEASLICRSQFSSADEAAKGMVANGAYRALVTDGGDQAAICSEHASVSVTPPKVSLARITGAGDTFMAAHIAAELGGETEEQSLRSAVDCAARYVSGDDTI